MDVNSSKSKLPSPSESDATNKARSRSSDRSTSCFHFPAISLQAQQRRQTHLVDDEHEEVVKVDVFPRGHLLGFKQHLHPKDRQRSHPLFIPRPRPRPRPRPPHLRSHDGRGLSEHVLDHSQPPARPSDSLTRPDVRQPGSVDLDGVVGREQRGLAVL
eukprot:768456-Hanusia_phi.AAC.4